jgi:NAD+ synthase
VRATLTTARLVKSGDGADDVKPIAHLYRTGSTSWPRRSARDEIRARPPTTDTCSLPRSQQEVFLSLPYQGMDACL